MNYKKNFPNWLAQSVFIKNGDIEVLNGLDYDLFLWLIYNTHHHYFKTKKLSTEFLYTDIKESFEKSLNTDSIKKSLVKLNGMSVMMNCLKSYGDKKIKEATPFRIKLLVDEEVNKSHGFTVTTNEAFMKSFDNPNPKVTLDYNNTTNVKSVSSKLLYLLLRDAYGKYKDVKRNRIIDIYDLKELLNEINEETTNSQFVVKLKKYVKSINSNTDIYVTFQKMMKLHHNGKKEMEKIKFTISLKSLPVLVTQKKNSKDTLSVEKPIEEMAETVDADTVIETDPFEEFLDSKVKEIVKNRHDIKNIEAFSKSTKNNLRVKEDVLSEYSFYQMMDDEKKKLKPKIQNNQPHIVILTNGNPYCSCYVNEKYQFVNIIDIKIQTSNVNETIEFFENKMVDGYYWDILQSDQSDKFNVARI
ncbi:MAG TPA: hypothetical protein PLM93_11170 [Sulfuricurvum sp.]|nr:MAG: hypothetical protein B7X89_12035 [Sulfuricurvum sp. 17-40-25]HQS67733.1 hypothetical protein [Sulfuricurvum sp.]HQT37668.1 hypothetical protein [Sulfuricurvum sp.]